MDSALWGVMRLAQGLPLWHMEDGQNFVNTLIDWNGLWQWIVYYYNPIGSYPVWADNWPEGSGLPNAALIFWSIALRIAFPIALIVWQKKQEDERKEVSLKDLILLKIYTKKKI